MAKLKLVDAGRWLNDRYDAELTYQQLYMFGVQRRIPVDRDDNGRFWVIDDADLPGIAKTLGLAKRPKPAAKPAGKPSAKPKPAAKSASTRPARSRAVTRPAA
jgi:hypothetical protein